MFIEFIWLLIGILLIGYTSYKIGYRFGRMNGYDRYDKEIEAMQKKGEVTFPSLKDVEIARLI